jgi:hypothetical protein
MVKQSTIFNDDWLWTAETKNTNASWVNDVVETLDTTGQLYLSTLRLWFEKFPPSPKKKKDLRARLESFQNDEPGPHHHSLQREVLKNEKDPEKKEHLFHSDRDCYVSGDKSDVTLAPTGKIAHDSGDSNLNRVRHGHLSPRQPFRQRRTG